MSIPSILLIAPDNSEDDMRVTPKYQICLFTKLMLTSAVLIPSVSVC